MNESFARAGGVRARWPPGPRWRAVESITAFLSTIVGITIAQPTGGQCGCRRAVALVSDRTVTVHPVPPQYRLQVPIGDLLSNVTSPTLLMAV